MNKGNENKITDDHKRGRRLRGDVSGETSPPISVHPCVSCLLLFYQNVGRRMEHYWHHQPLGGPPLECLKGPQTGGPLLAAPLERSKEGGAAPKDVFLLKERTAISRPFGLKESGGPRDRLRDDRIFIAAILRCTDRETNQKEQGCLI